MREIKFRARAIADNIHSNIKSGEFVYGCYIESGCDAPCIIFGDGEQIEVDKKSLGQFTGLTNKNEKDIYEGDIVKTDTNYVDFVTVDSYGVDFDGGYDAGDYYVGQFPSTWNWSKFEIIGNIHENKDLLDE